MRDKNEERENEKQDWPGCIPVFLLQQFGSHPESHNVRMHERYVDTAIILNEALVPFSLRLKNGETKPFAEGTTIISLSVAIVHDLVITKVTSVMKTELIFSRFIYTPCLCLGIQRSSQIYILCMCYILVSRTGN